MSFVDLATLTMHRRNELDARLNIFQEKCDRAIDDIKKLKMKTQDFTNQLNCDPSELKERFLRCMKQLDEYMYLITDFNLAISQLDERGSIDYTPVQDTAVKTLMPLPTQSPFNLMDALSEPAPSTSKACPNHCPAEKPKKIKTPKDQSLIVFSSTSSSEETMPQAKAEKAVKEVQCDLPELDELKSIKIDDGPIPSPSESCNLPAQSILESDQFYTATIMHVDGAFFWVITDDTDEVQSLMIEMTNFYRAHRKPLSLKEVMTLTCCAYYDTDSECYYRGLFLKLAEEDNQIAEIFVVDTGEMRSAPINCIQPLYKRFCVNPPYARCCHLAGVDLQSYHNKSLMDKQEVFMKGYVGTQCTIEVDDNTSESLGVYVHLESGETLNKMLVQHGLASPNKSEARGQSRELRPTQPNDDFDITTCPEYENPVEAVTGYINRDDIEICKHYKGGPEKTCFKGNRCKKRHILKHPDGWTLDRISVIGKCKSLPLPQPGTWHRVLVTYVCHFDRVYVQLVQDNEPEELPSFGVVLPPKTLTSLIEDMNSPATIIAYKPLTITPGQGELVAAMYPPDNSWYRARVQSVTRADQSVEVQYVDYGTTLWVKEDQLRCLEPRHTVLPMQAIRCRLAGVKPKSRQSQQWAQAKRALAELVQDKTVNAHIIAREYDEVTVELCDDEGYSIAEHLASINMVDLTDYSVEDDTAVKHKIIVP